MHWKLFEELYESFAKRKAVEKITKMKESLISALYANSNYDDDKGTRVKAISELEAKFDDAVKIIYGGNPTSGIDWEDPFFSASKAPRIGYDFGVPDKIAVEKEESRQAAIKELDQF